jgi:sugar/nucleoside kinase (ribokinase family)
VPDAPGSTTPTVDVLGIGNALVDVLSSESDELVERLGMAKGSMDLIDEDRMAEIYAAMGPATEVSGGSAANTMAGIASLGGSAHYIGRVRDDQLGAVFAHDIRSLGVGYTLTPAAEGPATGCCLILVTPDAQRTMNTFLGSSALLAPEDVDEQVVASAGITFLEGYLFDQAAAKEAFRTAAAYAHRADRQVALTLSDLFCVERHRDAFRDLVAGHVDILFANEAEILALYEVDDFDRAAEAVRADCPLAVLTRSEAGAVIVTDDERVAVPAHPVEELVDTTGAGDQYAAGFLYGLSRGDDLERCGRLGALAAAEVISHLGPRPQVSLAELVARELGPA